MKKTKQILSYILIAVMMLSSLPISVFAESIGLSTDAVISVESANAMPGSTVNVDLKIANNPGILGMTLSLKYDEQYATLTSVQNGDALSAMTFTTPKKLHSGVKLPWDAENVKPEDIKDGVIATLSFKIAEKAPEDEMIDISLSYDQGAIINNNMEALNVNLQAGYIKVINYTPGDLNDDGIVNTTDVVLLRRYIAGGYGVVINEAAADVNDDGILNTTDVVSIRRYIAGGYGVVLKPSSPKCEHTMNAVAYKAATCTEDGNIAYWHCSKCDKYFRDAKGTTVIILKDTVIAATGHKVVTDPAIEPSFTSTGLTEGSHCTVCNTVIKKQEVIPKLEKNEYAITYHIDNNDNYLKQQKIDNDNPSTYSSDENIVLQDLMVEGYNFKGWYTAQTGGTKVTEISAGSKGNKVLYAQWEKVEYTVTFDSPDVPVSEIKYTVDKGATLVSPSWFGYTFVGWSNDNGFIIDSIKPGTTGAITLHANWTSNRNKATSYSTYGEPIIIEDDVKGQFLFCYDIGKIENVPLSQIEYIGNTQELKIDNNYEITNHITSDKAESIANTIANTTTKTSGWVLSEEWNKIYENGSEYEDTKIKSQQRTDAEGNVVGGKYFVSNSSGGSSFVSNESGGSNSSSSKVTTEKSKGINGSYDTSTGTYVDGKLGISNSTEVSAGVSLPVKVVDVSAGIKNTTTVSAEVAAGRKDNTAVHLDGSASSYTGTVNTSGSSSYYKSVANNSSTWNSTTSKEKSYESSRSTEITSALSQQISKKTSYNVTDSLGGSNSKTESVAGTDSRQDEYSTTLKYSEGNSTTTTKHITFSSDRPGYYRLVTAGTVHVFGVVGYDVATASYYTYTFNVLDDERHEYLDYSKDNANFNDCENGIVSFEIPYEVNEYIVGVTGKTAGLEFDLNGTVTDFEEKEGFDGTVTIPQYYSVNNGDGTYSAYKTERFNANVFKGNTNIKTVVLPTYVTEIPDGAFEGCTNLERVIAYGVTKIGNNAFKGCTSLEKFSIDNLITSLGTNAFENAPEIAVMAANSDVADAAINSGAKSISLNISEMKGSFDNKLITVDNTKEYFALMSNGSTYSNLQIDSKAKKTFISNIKFTENSDTPLKIDSAKVTLNRVTVENAPGFALILPADNTELNLFATVDLSTKGENAVISKNVTLNKADPEVAGKLKLKGNYLVCGEVGNSKMLEFTSGELIKISEDEFNTYLTSSIVSFDPNGGELSETSKPVYYGQTYGDLPVPTKANYTFDGWYTAETDGTKITESSVVNALANQTLYAHWSPKEFTITFDANGGTVSQTSKTVAYASEYGELPTPTRDYYTFIGWYDKAEISENDTAFTADTVAESSNDVTLYAQWRLNEPSEYVLASELPEGAQIVNQKWTYTLREYTTNGASSLSGWTKYDTKRTSWGATQGPVYSNPANGARNVWSESYVTSSNYKTVYHYYRYAVNREGGYGSYAQSSSYPNYYEYDFDSPLEYYGDVYGHAGYKWWYSSSHYVTLYQRSPFTTQEWVSNNYGTRWYYQEPVYTYYYYRDLDKEAATNPTGQSNVSNVQEWVQYRIK
ncbi:MULTISPECIES: InlB B-repeat-containing protein [unclassified Ruminococcus]|uniref:InlB B-repeat-containing protein n=1 Tax=unclassified Ruminococcus TaxID=2608920 RepID=UPI00210B97A2|nr:MULTISPECIES: InlB B-repeat-containing protein [unclassified Ruminococcus]MCQ4023359.1 leucine-rich repeat protein [Ruminococcus sp. zg-924]MCQ4115708.1 leucine-rich repeat protein [Ruminococcus sp. zg-921]